MRIFGAVLLGLGALGSLWVLVDNYRYWKIKESEPQGAPHRILPEAHGAMAILGAIGAWMAWGLLPSALVFAGWLVVVVGLTWAMSR